MQPVDLTTLVAIAHELDSFYLPARLEQVYQSDRHTLYFLLRTLEQKIWLLASWHPQSARLHLSSPPPSQPDTFTFSQQIWHQVVGLALVSVQPINPWERVIDLQFAKRPGDPVQAHLYLEIMGKYSNVILVNESGLIVTAAHQVSNKQSRVRPIQTGDLYELPPALLDPIPSLAEPLEAWRDRLSLIPQPVQRSLLTNYRGLSSALTRSLLDSARIEQTVNTDDLSPANWQNLFDSWQWWLQCLTTKTFFPARQGDRYTMIAPPETVAISANQIIAEYYTKILEKQDFQQLGHQINQALLGHLQKLVTKEGSFSQRLAQSAQAEAIKTEADLLMAYIQEWQPGMSAITVKDFTTSAPVTIALDPQQTVVQNAQGFYKKYQKQKRAKQAIAPLLEAVNQEIHYLQQVTTAASQLEIGDFKSLQEIQLELIQQGYLKAIHDPKTESNKKSKQKKEAPLNCHRFQSFSGFEIWVGRNNFQNDTLTFRVANEYDLWFHTQEIPGSHLLLRIQPGAIAESQDLQNAADFAAYYSQARQSDRVPVVFTKPKYVFKPKGAKPGMVVYKQEQIIWGQPRAIG
jgi:predicted ribosome quality control (RQC) complex YloA/Tae2 family protein